MTYGSHQWCQFDHRCVDCGVSKENIAIGLSTTVCTWPPPGCEEADPRDGSWGRSIPHTLLTSFDRLAFSLGELPDWVTAPDRPRPAS